MKWLRCSFIDQLTLEPARMTMAIIRTKHYCAALHQYFSLSARKVLSLIASVVSRLRLVHVVAVFCLLTFVLATSDGGVIAMSISRHGDDQSVGPIRVFSTRISPNSEAILISFDYRDESGQLPAKLAVVSTDPGDQRVALLEPPPMLHWFSPSWSPTSESFLAVSYCSPTKPDGYCYDDARGYHVWEFGIGTGRLERKTSTSLRWRKESPVYTANSGTIMYVVSDINTEHGFSSTSNARFFAINKNGEEKILFPKEMELRGEKPAISIGDLINDVVLTSAVDTNEFVFFGHVAQGWRGNIRSNKASAFEETKRLSLKWKHLLFRLVNLKMSVLSDSEVTSFAAPPFGRTSYVFARFAESHTPYISGEMMLVEDGVPHTLFEFSDGQIEDLSVSNDLQSIVFAGDVRQREGVPNSYWKRWLYD